MGDKRKAAAEDIPGAGKPPPRVARTETIPGDDTAGTLAQAAAGPGTSQAPAGAGLTAATTPGFLFGGALGRGGGSGHGGFSPPHSWAPPTLGNPGGAGGSASGYGSVSGGQNQTAGPWQTGTVQPHGDSCGQSSSRAASPVSSYAGALRGEQQYRAGLEALDAGLLAAERILNRPRCNFCRELTTLVLGEVPFCPTCFRHHFLGGPPPQHAQIGGAPREPVALPTSEQEFRADLAALDAELLEVTRTLKNLKVGSGPICKACGRLSGSNNACGVCRQGSPPPPPPGLS